MINLILLNKKFKNEYFFSLKYCKSLASSSLSLISIALLLLKEERLDTDKFIGFFKNSSNISCI